MDQLMCMKCGEFLLAVLEDGELVPEGEDRCPECGRAEFEDVGEWHRSYTSNSATPQQSTPVFTVR